MKTNFHISPSRTLGKRDKMIYGHFIEHFHRQIYGGVFDPSSPFADSEGLRTDVLDAMRKIKVPILRWPGGCFVSSYNWKKGVGPSRAPVFDKAWRVEDPNTFGTDEYVAMCRKLGCEPYICTNAGTGTPEEMSDWLEYCNLDHEGEFARWRIANGYREPYKVKYWSIGNENYGAWELGAKAVGEWGRFALESAKLMKHVDPDIELSAAALADVHWNVDLLSHCGRHLDWISIHKYWDRLNEVNAFADYEQSMAYTNDLDTDINKVRGLLTAMGLEKRIKIAYDEWNLRGWHHPKVLNGRTREEYLLPRDKNDHNPDYTMADAVFSACFLNTLNRNCDIVGMANFAPVVNTRGCIFTHEDGMVLRSTYHIFDLYVNYVGDEILDGWMDERETMSVVGKNGQLDEVSVLDVLPTRMSETGMLCVAAVNKHALESRALSIAMEGAARAKEYRLITVNGESTESYNDIGVEQVRLTRGEWKPVTGNVLNVTLQPHSANVIQLKDIA
ncbi:MAG: alpha-L-arabinofuranosidase C-terminal domain-containing protein [Christensenellales bacterium]|jgi:alpha-N-arabinofuranosidase